MSDDARAQGPSYRIPRHNGGMDPATRRLALIAAGLGGALFVVIGAWSMLGGHGGPVPVISPPDTPIRVKPANPGGLKITNDMEAFGSGLTDASGDKLAPAPETPDPQALHTPAKVYDSTVLPQPPAAAASAPASAPPPAPAMSASSLPPVQATVPAPQPVPQAAPPPPAPAAQHAPTAGGGHQVQLAALSTRAEAEKEWDLLARRSGGLLSGHSPIYAQAVVNGRTWWRVRTGGFADEAAARGFCDHMRAKGAACSVARF